MRWQPDTFHQQDIYYGYNFSDLGKFLASESVLTAENNMSVDFSDSWNGSHSGIAAARYTCERTRLTESYAHLNQCAPDEFGSSEYALRSAAGMHRNGAIRLEI